jgi:hypothetical protein
MSTMQEILEQLEDTTLYPSLNGPRDPSSPAFIFFDDDKALSETDRMARDHALDYEEWKMAILHSAELKAGAKPARRVKRIVPAAPQPVLKPSLTAKELFQPSKRDKKRALALTRKVTEQDASFHEVEDSFDDELHSTATPKAYKLVEYVNYAKDIEDGIEPRVRQCREVDYHELMAHLRYSNWLVNFYKRLAKNTDRYGEVASKILSGIDLDDSALRSKNKRKLKKLLRKHFIREVKVALKESNKTTAPIAGTVFVNPDGTRYETMGTNPTSAKASYAKRHKLEPEEVSADRVQYEGEDRAKWVVGRRRVSSETPSNWYDPNPQWTEIKNLKGEWIKSYHNDGRPIHFIPETKVFDGHRLTIREFEQAIISGAPLIEDEGDLVEREIEGGIADIKTYRIIDQGYGSEQRDPRALSDVESELYHILINLQLNHAADMVLCAHQDLGLIQTYFHDNAEDINAVLTEAAKGEATTFHWIKSVITHRGNDETASLNPDERRRALARGNFDGPSTFDVWLMNQPSMLQIPTDTGSRIATYRHWS